MIHRVDQIDINHSFGEFQPPVFCLIEKLGGVVRSGVWTLGVVGGRV